MSYVDVDAEYDVDPKAKPCLNPISNVVSDLIVADVARKRTMRNDQPRLMRMLDEMEKKLDAAIQKFGDDSDCEEARERAKARIGREKIREQEHYY